MSAIADGGGVLSGMDLENDPSKWHPQQQAVLRTWAERIQIHRVLHEMSHHRYRKYYLWFTLPVIIISTLAGGVNLAQQSLETYMPSDDIIPFTLGLLNIVAGLVTTVSQFLKVGELMALHRQAAITYARLARAIEVQLELPRRLRKISGSAMISQTLSELDSLAEQMPAPPVDIMQRLSRRLRKRLPGMAKPEIMELYPVVAYNSPDNSAPEDGESKPAQPPARPPVRGFSVFDDGSSGTGSDETGRPRRHDRGVGGGARAPSAASAASASTEVKTTPHPDHVVVELPSYLAPVASRPLDGGLGVLHELDDELEGAEV